MLQNKLNLYYAIVWYIREYTFRLGHPKRTFLININIENVTSLCTVCHIEDC